jgi:hypothetical protein
LGQAEPQKQLPSRGKREAKRDPITLKGVLRHALDKVITPKVEGSTYANMIGTDQKRIITSLTADELKFTNPRTPTGVTLEIVWKRAK